MTNIERIRDALVSGINLAKSAGWTRHQKDEVAEAEEALRLFDEMTIQASVKSQLLSQDVEEFIAGYSQTEPIRDKYGDAYYEIDIIEVGDLRAWMTGHVRVPVGWQFYQDGKWWHGDDRIKDHRKNTEEAGFPVRDVYADPQPTTCIGCEGVPGPKNSPCAVCGQKSTPDVTALVEALECALETMENVDGENDCSRGIDAVEEALAAHRKGGAAASDLESRNNNDRGKQNAS